MNFLITECGLTPTIISENPLVLTSDPYILKERCLFLQYYIENNGIPSSLHNFDFIRLKGKTTQGKISHLGETNTSHTVLYPAGNTQLQGLTIDPSVIGQMLHGNLLTPKIRDNRNPISKKKDLEIFCSLLNIDLADYYSFIAKL